ncbi:MAG: tetratricopeptide (TPR) repeat protein [Lentimonas sp.]|jgi:tetratricopeptide (TPR) repeat protein
MSRLYLTLTAILYIGLVFSQTETKKILEFADKKFAEGDYYYALELYQNALDLDSNSIGVLYKYAITAMVYKDYRKAEKYFQKVYSKEESIIYPESIIYLGLMQKQNGKYEEALETFKLAKKRFATSRDEYNYIKAKQEIQSCLWAINALTNKNLKAKKLPDFINSKDAEFGHRFANNRLIFSSLKADSMSSNEEVYSENYHTLLYSSSQGKNDVRPLPSLNNSGENVGNGSFSIDSSRFYYSACKTEKGKYSCQIMVADYKDFKFENPDVLGQIVNTPSANTTMPFVAMLKDKEVLFFASDKPGGMGGLDLYYTEIRNGNQYFEPNNLESINSVEDDVSPFYDSENSQLYFSSSWHYSLGGMDVHSSLFNGKNFEEPQNLLAPINSPANDIYFFIHDSIFYVSSNRVGVNYSKNPTCCTDVFAFGYPQPEIDTLVPLETEKETLISLLSRLPVTLYFHNDQPNPRTNDTVTTVNYIHSYSDYKGLLLKYQNEYSSGLDPQKAIEAREDIESFFIEFIDQGVTDLDVFTDLLWVELEKGRRINLTVKGFASPLAKSDYNLNLAKRRIYSLKNYLSIMDDKKFLPYLIDSAGNGGLLSFTEIPFGEYVANKLVSDNLNDQKNSVYSRAAGLERKIEIQSVNFLTDSIVDNPVSVENNVVELGVINRNENVTVEYEITNSNDHAVEFEPIRVPCHCSNASMEKNLLLPGEKTKVRFEFDPSEYTGEVVKSIYIRTKKGTEEIRLILTAIID